VHEVRASLYDLDKRPLITSFMAGLGGDVIMLEDFYYMADPEADGGGEEGPPARVLGGFEEET